jgi:hypothetical protein
MFSPHHRAQDVELSLWKNYECALIIFFENEVLSQLFVISYINKI